MAPEPITQEIVRARAALAGVRIEEERLGQMADALEQSLAPLRTLDLRALRPVEPPFTFRTTEGDAGATSP